MLNETPLAEVSDLADRWRPILPAEEGRVAVLLGDASSLLRAEFPDIDDRITAGTLSATVAAAIVCQMAKRALISPEGVSQDSETAGPYSHSQSYANPMGNVFITTAERTLILGQRLKGMTVRFV